MSSPDCFQHRDLLHLRVGDPLFGFVCSTDVAGRALEQSGADKVRAIGGLCHCQLGVFVFARNDRDCKSRASRRDSFCHRRSIDEVNFPAGRGRDSYNRGIPTLRRDGPGHFAVDSLFHLPAIAIWRVLARLRMARDAQSASVRFAIRVSVRDFSHVGGTRQLFCFASLWAGCLCDLRGRLF